MAIFNSYVSHYQRVSFNFCDPTESNNFRHHRSEVWAPSKRTFPLGWLNTRPKYSKYAKAYYECKSFKRTWRNSIIINYYKLYSVKWRVTFFYTGSKSIQKKDPNTDPRSWQIRAQCSQASKNITSGICNVLTSCDQCDHWWSLWCCSFQTDIITVK